MAHFTSPFFPYRISPKAFHRMNIGGSTLHFHDLSVECALDAFPLPPSSLPEPSMPGATSPSGTGITQKSSSPTLSRTPTRELFKTIVTITVGPKAHQFFAHREILSAVSSFFAAALNPTYNFSESSSSACSLPEARVDDFEYFVQWLYTHSLDHEDLNGPHPAYYRLIRLYVLADQLGVSLLKNAILDIMGKTSDRSNACPTPADTKMTYACTTESSRLRVMVLDLFEWKTVDKLIETHEHSWDELFLRNLIVRLKRKGTGKVPFPWRDKAESCKRYHEHDQWAPCDGGREKRRICRVEPPKIGVGAAESAKG